jgi:hypothetical protein
VAGGLALLAEARPQLNAFELKGVLTGSARKLPGAPITAQGSGLVDLGRAAAAGVSVNPATLALSPAFPGHPLKRTLLVKNVSGGPLTLSLSPGGPDVRVIPRRLRMPTGKVKLITVEAHAPRSGFAQGAIRLVSHGSVSRVPWVVARSTRVRLLAGMCIAPSYTAPCTHRPLAFKPSPTSTAVLAIRVGQVLSRNGTREVRPVSRLEITMKRLEGNKPLGTLVQLRDLLPGQYAFALTGRGPAGQRLLPAVYRLAVTAYPDGGGRPTSTWQRFTIKR